MTIKQQDASVNGNAQQGYDAIAFTGAVPSVPNFYRNKLKMGGRLFAVLGKTSQATMEAVLITRVRESEWSQDSLFETRLEPLINFDSESPSFEF